MHPNRLGNTTFVPCLLIAAFLTTVDGFAKTAEVVVHIGRARTAAQQNTLPRCDDPRHSTCKIIALKLPAGSEVMNVEAFARDSGTEQWYGPCPKSDGSLDCGSLIGFLRLSDYKLQNLPTGLAVSWRAINGATKNRDVRVVVHYFESPVLYDPPMGKLRLR